MPPAASSVTPRRILSLARPEARRLSAGVFFLFIGSGLSLLFPQAIRLIIDEALGARDQALIDRATLWMTVIFAVTAVANALRYYFFTSAGENVVQALRERLFSHLVSQEVAFFDNSKTGELVTRLGADTAVLQQSVSGNIAMALRSGAQVLGGVALLFYTSPTLTLLMLTVVPPVVVVAMVYGRRMRLTSRRVNDEHAASNAVAEEIFVGIRTVRSFAAERHEGGRYSVALAKALALARRRTQLSAFFIGGSTFGGFIAGSLVLWYGSRLMLRGDLSIGSLTSFLVYTTLVSMSVSGLTDLWADFMRASGSAERVFDLLDRKPGMPISGGERIDPLQGHVEFQSVRFAYPTRLDAPVLKDLNLAIQPGEVVAIVGPSGAGKSTIAGLLARMYDPQGGSLLLDGRDLRTVDPEWLRQQIGVVAQEPMLFSGSIFDNIRYGRLDATEAEVEAAARAANAHDFVCRFPDGYRTSVGERGVQLSGGQKQRVAIARAILKDPRLLVLDEATSALDAESEHLVKDALERLMRGRTTLIIAHRLSTVLGADRVLVLEGGQVVQSGSHASLMEQEGLYRRLVERQFAAA
ncbi:ATP-binding cassette domain-containing protein [Corallococcus exiguus]|uniref:ATP-binding cassette domain-containing protein n=1 Tax=Corallococcus exiguus TaxID=83462 RepID=A0A7Y1S9D2_9BACT|nr:MULTISPECIES: ABC transporter transmembrane domain-containing protein [Corallococcus]NBC43824.1 ATP-binding cassette domain-containing protein [Corallococcus exiguus]NNC20712.1 ATP-binding cassette domain-containing protein [Corallococcus exiguus]NRD65146.1 ATP-binding cassette domain-containing protein [Corallococcus exiguus]RKI15211.1 ATP-binding cassette domain-containing protein [Corallococcus sp. AB030]RUO92701.1 ATP-binding cassette domain-containing protein [Corallococcus sp. AB018]